jgi:hypothetical protein
MLKNHLENIFKSEINLLLMRLQKQKKYVAFVLSCKYYQR